MIVPYEDLAPGEGITTQHNGARAKILQTERVCLSAVVRDAHIGH